VDDFDDVGEECDMCLRRLTARQSQSGPCEPATENSVRSRQAVCPAIVRWRLNGCGRRCSMARQGLTGEDDCARRLGRCVPPSSSVPCRLKLSGTQWSALSHLPSWSASSFDASSSPSGTSHRRLQGSALPICALFLQTLTGRVGICTGSHCLVILPRNRLLLRRGVRWLRDTDYRGCVREEPARTFCRKAGQ
jgi:hypothetical protein